MCSDPTIAQISELHGSSQKLIREMVLVLGALEGMMVPLSVAERVGGTRTPGPPGDLRAAAKHREMCAAFSELHRATLGRAYGILGGDTRTRRGPRLSKGPAKT